MFIARQRPWSCLSLRGMATKPRNHYEALGVKSSATQGEIKTAYYELSKLHHPDTNQGSQDSLTKFRQVAEAYEVLGNVSSRKLYDRGLTVSGSGTSLRQDGENFQSSHRRRDRKMPTNVGDTTIYDFDAWTRAHYVATKQRKADTKVKYNTIKYREREDERMLHVGSLGIFFIIFSVAVMTLTNSMISEDYDVVSQKKTLKAKEAT